MRQVHISNHLVKFTADRKLRKLRRWQREARAGDIRARQRLDDLGLNVHSSTWIDDSPKGRVRYQVLAS